MDINSLIFLTEVWIILAIVLIVADLVLGVNYLLLPIGVACFLIAILAFLKNNGLIPEFIGFDNWRHVGLWFAGFSLISIGLLKLYGRSTSKSDEDINKY